MLILSLRSPALGLGQGACGDSAKDMEGFPVHGPPCFVPCDPTKEAKKKRPKEVCSGWAGQLCRCVWGDPPSSQEEEAGSP